MTLIEFNDYLKENITNEMFESLVLNYLKNRYQIIFCTIDEYGNKKYTLQDSFMGDMYYLIINPLNAKSPDNYALDKHMIANKDETTLFLLANDIWGEHPKNLPANARCLLAYINELNDNPAAFFNCDCIDFAERINGVAYEKFRKYKQYIEDLYEKCVDETIKLLLQEGYLSNEKDWNRKTNRIKLTGTNGENRVCECRVDSRIGCVFFTVRDPYYPLHYHLNDEEDIPLLATQIVQLIKEKREF